MKLLLDTHTLLWWMDDPGQITESARDVIADPVNTVFVSAVVAWEIAIKRALGKLTIPGDLRQRISDSGFTTLPISVEHCLATESLPSFHRDPFDRLLIAQSFLEDAIVVSRDEQFVAYGVPIIHP